MLCWDGVPGFINSSIPLKSISSSVMFSTPHICCALGVRPALDVSETPRFQPLLLQGTLLHQPSPSQSSGFLRCHCCLSATSGESRGMRPTSVSMVTFSGCLSGFLLPPREKGLGLVVPLLPAGSQNWGFVS